VPAGAMTDPGGMDEQTALMNDEPVVTGPEQRRDNGAGFPPPGSERPRVPWYRLPVFRDTSDDMLGGVISGISQAYGFDRRTTRIALVLAAFVLPVLILVYVIAWILLPDSADRAQPLADILGDRRRFPLYVALGLVVIAGGIGSLGSWFVFGDFPWGVGLVALGVLLWAAPSLRSGRARHGRPPTAAGPGSSASGTSTSATSTTFPLPAAADVTTASDAIDGAPDLASSTDDTLVDPTFAGIGSTGHGGTVLVPPAMPERPRRRRRPIGSISLLGVIAFVGIASAGDAIDWWNIPVLAVVVTSIIVLALGLAVSTIVNRAWFFVPIVLLLAATAGLLIAADPSLDGGIGERTSRPSTVADAQIVHDIALGELTLDLVDVPLDLDTPVRVVAEVGVGRLHVIVPAGATLMVTSDMGAGEVLIGDRQVVDGIRQQDLRTIAAIGDERGTIELDLRVGIGQIDIDRDVFAVAGTPG
jgi:phage shock protein PspC (stress-responsive transcriptional regulator)